MLQFKDKSKYDLYVEELKEAIDKNTWKKFMNDNEYMDVYFSSTYVPNIGISTLSSPYYSEISINAIRSCNVSSARKEIPSNWERVVGAVRSILEGKCMPIAVIKLDNNEYYIENGKHRFYAHILLGRDKIPVSIREINNRDTSKEVMLSYNVPFYNNDGMDIAYPDKVEDFIDQYMNVESQIKLIAKKTTEIESLISNIKQSLDTNDKDSLRVKLNKLDSLNDDFKMTTSRLNDDFYDIKIRAKSVKIEKLDDNQHIFSIEMNHDRNIIITGTCSSGNETRASRCTCNILNKLGYPVDMNYISNNVEFKLEDKRDAHNINFDIYVDENVVNNEILKNIKQKRNYNDTKDLERDFLKLIDYISRHKAFETPGTHFSWYSSSFIEVDSANYYLVGAENIDSIDSIYVFKSYEVPFNNLTIQFLGRIKSDTELYKKLTEKQ